MPVGLTIVEEGVATDKPFLRLEIRPTFPPHYDGKGRRVTRDGAATRSLTDEELLDIYLDREAAKFEQRFQQTAKTVLARLDELAEGVPEVSDELGSASSAAWEAASNADDSTSVARMLEDDIESLFDFAEEQALLTLPQLYFRLVEKRQVVWSAFSKDAASRPTKATDGLIERLRKQLEQAIDPNDWASNLGELQFWKAVLEERGDRGTMTAGNGKSQNVRVTRSTPVFRCRTRLRSCAKTSTGCATRRVKHDSPGAEKGDKGNEVSSCGAGVRRPDRNAVAHTDPDDSGPDTTTNEVCGAFNLGVPPGDIPGRLGANDGRENYWTAQRQSAWPIIEGDCG